MNAPNKRPKVIGKIISAVGSALFLLLLTASNASAGEGGETNGFVLPALGIAAGVVVVGAVIHMTSPRNKRAGNAMMVAGAIGAVGMLAVGAFTGVWSNDDTPAAPAAAFAPSTGSTNYAKTVDLIFVVRDFHTGAAVASADVYVYRNASAYTQQQTFQRSVPSMTSCSTDSAGKCTVAAIDAEPYDVCVSKAGYYTAFEACQWGVKNHTTLTASALDSSPDYMVTGFHLRQHGTADLAKTSSTIASGGCTAGTSTCPLVIFYGNDEADSIIAYPAVKLMPKAGTDTTATNLTFASMATGTSCTYAVVNQVYFVYDTTDAGLLAAKQWKSCGVNLNYASGSANGKIGLTLDDGFIPRLYAAMAAKPGIPVGDFETNTNWPSLSAATLDVTR